MQQLADILVEIEKHPFEAMGSLVFSAGNAAEFDVQGLAHPSTFRIGGGCGGGGPLGPFSSPVEGARTLLESYLAMIANGEIGTGNPVDVYLAHRFRLDVVDRLWGDAAGAPPGGPFFLKHPSDEGDHILVNGAFAGRRVSTPPGADSAGPVGLSGSVESVESAGGGCGVVLRPPRLG